jgi:hypothetical protein
VGSQIVLRLGQPQPPTCSYIIVFNYSVVVDIYIYMLTCLTAKNTDNFKFPCAPQAKIVYNYKRTNEKLNKWQKNTETCRRFTTCLYSIVSNNSALVDIYIYLYIYMYMYTQ